MLYVSTANYTTLRQYLPHVYDSLCPLLQLLLPSHLHYVGFLVIITI